MAAEASASTPQVSRGYDALEMAVVDASTPPTMSRQGSLSGRAPEQPEQATASSEDPIAAMDTLDDEVAKVSAEVPEVQTSPEKPKRPTQKSWEKPAPVVRTTKASQARLSLAQGDKSILNKGPALGKPRTSVGLGRSSSVRQSTNSSKPAEKRVVSMSGSAMKPADTPASGEKGQKTERAMPHSKPRPVSVSFPAPPPPAKSTKAPTKANFQLPGEAVAAKLKAQREERTKREAEEAEAKKAAGFKARPVPAGLKKAPSVRQTNASKARESLGAGKPAPALVGGSHQRAKSVATKPTAAGPANGKSFTPGLDAIKVHKRASTAMANTSKPRTSLGTSTSSHAAAGSRVPSKGKEVFSRFAASKEAAEKEKHAKEDAAKKARADAAERGRQASREWAEKQKLRKSGLKPAAKTTTTPAAKPTEDAGVVTEAGQTETLVEAA